MLCSLSLSSLECVVVSEKIVALNHRPALTSIASTASKMSHSSIDRQCHAAPCSQSERPNGTARASASTTLTNPAIAYSGILPPPPKYRSLHRMDILPTFRMINGGAVTTASPMAHTARLCSRHTQRVSMGDTRTGTAARGGRRERETTKSRRRRRREKEDANGGYVCC